MPEEVSVAAQASNLIDQIVYILMGAGLWGGSKAGWDRFRQVTGRANGAGTRRAVEGLETKVMPALGDIAMTQKNVESILARIVETQQVLAKSNQGMSETMRMVVENQRSMADVLERMSDKQDHMADAQAKTSERLAVMVAVQQDRQQRGAG